MVKKTNVSEELLLISSPLKPLIIIFTEEYCAL